MIANPILCLYVPGFHRKNFTIAKTLSKRSKRSKEQKQNKGSQKNNSKKTLFGLVMSHSCNVYAEKKWQITDKKTSLKL